MPFLIFLAIALWFAFGRPTVTIANWYWPDDAAPWESVTAFYYPDRLDLSLHQSMPGLSSVQACQDWVASLAEANGDPALQRSDYECAIQEVGQLGDITVFRTTVR